MAKDIHWTKDVDMANAPVKTKAKDLRREIKIDPKVELKDYSGRLRSDLRISDFSREQLAKMYLMSCEYFYDTLEAWAQHIIDKYGNEAMVEAQHDIWGKRMFAPAQRIKRKWMNIQGNDIEAMMKDLQIEATSYGDKFEVTYEMPSSDHGIKTYHRCPIVEQFEALGQEEVLRRACIALCVDSIAENATLYNPDIVTKNLALPPRKSKSDICCQWDFTYKSK